MLANLINFIVGKTFYSNTVHTSGGLAKQLFQHQKVESWKIGFDQKLVIENLYVGTN